MAPKSNRKSDKGAASASCYGNDDSGLDQRTHQGATAAGTAPKLLPPPAPEIVHFGKLAVDVARAKAGSKEVFMRFVTAFDQAKQVFASCGKLAGFEPRVCGSIISHGCTDGSSDIDFCLVKKKPALNTDQTKNGGDDDDDDADAREASSSANDETPGAIRQKVVERVRVMCAMFANLGGVWAQGLNPQLDTRLVFLNRQPPAESLRSCTATVVVPDAKVVLPSLVFVLNEVRQNSNRVPGLVRVIHETTNNNNNKCCSVELVFSSVMAAFHMQTKLVEILRAWISEGKSEISKDKKKQVLALLADVSEEPAKLKPIEWKWQQGLTALPQYPELFDTDFDISFNHHGLRNTLLLRRYITSNPIVYVGAAFIKEWGKQSGVRNSMIRLNSYALNILWVCFLLQQKVLAHINPISIPDNMSSKEFHSEIVSEKGHVDPFAGCGRGSPKEKQLQVQAGALLVEFFKFYANESFWDHNVVTLHTANGFESRDEHAKRTSCEWTPANEKPNDTTIGYYRMCVEDPYENNLNVARRIEQLEKANILKQISRMASGDHVGGWNAMEQLPEMRSRQSEFWRLAKNSESAITERSDARLEE